MGSEQISGGLVWGVWDYDLFGVVWSGSNGRKAHKNFWERVANSRISQMWRIYRTKRNGYWLYHKTKTSPQYVQSAKLGRPDLPVNIRYIGFCALPSGFVRSGASLWWRANTSRALQTFHAPIPRRCIEPKAIDPLAKLSYWTNFGALIVELVEENQYGTDDSVQGEEKGKILQHYAASRVRPVKGHCHVYFRAHCGGLNMEQLCAAFVALGARWLWAIDTTGWNLTAGKLRALREEGIFRDAFKRRLC